MIVEGQLAERRAGSSSKANLDRCSVGHCQRAHGSCAPSAAEGGGPREVSPGEMMLPLVLLPTQRQAHAELHLRRPRSVGRGSRSCVHACCCGPSGEEWEVAPCGGDALDHRGQLCTLTSDVPGCSHSIRSSTLATGTREPSNFFQRRGVHVRGV